MSFSLTKTQLLDGSKTVTRRLGWANLKPGDRLLAVSKCMGLRKGEKADVYGTIEIVSVRAERLCLMMPTDCAREGFPKADVKEFVRMFCAAMGCKPTDMVNRIEFRRVPKC